MHPNTKQLLLAAAVLACFAGSACGGVLLSDSAAMVKGADTFSKSSSIPFPPFTLWTKATVEYAIYAPGQVDDSSVLGNPSLPINATEYVYVYELFNLTGSTSPLTLLSIGLNPGVLSEDSVVGSISTIAEGGYAPTLPTFIPISAAWADKTNVKWEFNPGSIPVDQHSTFVFFTSPYEPSTRNATVAGANTAAGTLPSPAAPTGVPEPSTLVLSALAVLGLLATRYFRRRKV